jgi:hypothetical protein
VNLGVVLGAVGTLARVIDAWLISNDQRAAQTEKALALAARVRELPADAVVEAPLRARAGVGTLVFGERFMSWTAVRRYVAVSLLLLPFFLGAGGWMAGVPLGITRAPWQAYEEEVGKFRASMSSVQPQTEGAKWAREVLFPLLTHPQAKWRAFEPAGRVFDSPRAR